MRGALFMVIAMAGFTMSDAISKAVLASVNAGQMLLVRGIFATILIVSLGFTQGVFRHIRHLRHPTVAIRAVAELFATLTFIFSLANMPLATVSAILQALPLAVTMGAALFLGETVRWRRWAAIIVGFIGVMIVVRPGTEGFNEFSLLTLVSVIFCAIRDLATRSIPQQVPTMLISAMTAVVVTTVGGILIFPLGGWVPMETADVGLMALAAVLLLIGYQFIIQAMRMGDISFVAPYRYTGLLWAMVLGFFFFGDVPDTAMIIGSLVIVGSGLYALYREERASPNKPAAESTGPGMGPDGL